MVSDQRVTGTGSIISQLTSPTSVAALLIGFIIYSIGLGLYRLTLHPLAKFPGPKLAGLTYWYEFHYDVVQRGRYIFKIQELHRQYGPVLRVNPNEIHIADPEFYSEIYHSKSFKTDRDRWYNLDFIGESVLFTIDHDIHARRRAALASFFSARSIRALESRIKDVVQTMSDGLRKSMLAGTVLDLRHVYSALALDVITEYSFGKSSSTNFVSNPEWGKFWVDIGDFQVPMNPFARHFKLIFKALVKLPDRVSMTLVPTIADLLKWQDKMMQPAKAELERRSIQSIDQKSDQLEEDNIIHELINNPNLPPSDKTIGRIRDESFSLLAAGGETTASTLSRITFHLLDNPEKLQRLKQELKEAMPDPTQVPPLDTITQLSYLNAVIEEGLRISVPVSGRLARVFQDHPLVYKSWTIPPRFAVSQSTYFTQMDPNIFPEPTKFEPERWLTQAGIHKYQNAFSKGRRMCVGLNLAYAEIRLALACIFRRYELELFETSRKNIEMVHDYIVSQASSELRPVRIRIVGESK